MKSHKLLHISMYICLMTIIFVSGLYEFIVTDQNYRKEQHILSLFLFIFLKICVFCNICSPAMYHLHVCPHLPKLNISVTLICACAALSELTG